MKLVVINRKKVLFILLSFLAVITSLILYQRFHSPTETVQMIMGGMLYQQVIDEGEGEGQALKKSSDVETYFRPSDLPVLNDRFDWNFFRDYLFKKVNEITLPDYLLSSPEETIINYFSILREAENAEKDKLIGCGSIGNGDTPYPLAYHFLSSSYQKNMTYEQYLDSFKNILHMNLIKYKEVPLYDNPTGIIRYFVEIETIEGSDKEVGYFAYYYGFVDLIKEGGLYKISNLEFHGENYLCAPIHGWFYDAEASTQIRYGGWCKLIDTLYPTIQNGYVKHLYFKGTDGSDYMIEFYRLTNDYDIEIAQYKKDDKGIWKLIHLNPEKCLKGKS